MHASQLFAVQTISHLHLHAVYTANVAPTASSILADHRFLDNITVRHIHTHLPATKSSGLSDYTGSARLRIILKFPIIISFLSHFLKTPMSCHRPLRQDNPDQDHPVIATRHPSPLPLLAPVHVSMYVPKGWLQLVPLSQHIQPPAHRIPWHCCSCPSPSICICILRR